MILLMQQNREDYTFRIVNRQGIDKQGDFFVESSINFVTAIIANLIFHSLNLETAKINVFKLSNKIQPISVV